MNYIVDFKNSLTEAEVNQYMADNGMTKIKEYSFFDKVYLVSSSNAITPNDIIESAIQDDNNPIELHFL